MASGYISGKKNTIGSVNIPYKNVSYHGEETSTANVTVDNDERTISVDVNVENVTKQCATKTEVRDLSDRVSNLDETKADTSYVNTFGKSLDMSIDSSYDLVINLKDASGNIISTQDVDLPIEQMIVDAEYDNETKTIILTLDNGQTLEIPIGDLVEGLVSTDDLNQILSNYSTKEYANTNFVHKNSTAINSVYAVNGEGQDTNFGFNSTPVGFTIMNRDGNGKSQVNNPENSLDIANKQYVDNATSGKSNATNLENGTGVNSVQQKQSDKDVEFENPNYTPSYTYEVGAFGKDSAMLNGNSMAKGELSTAIGRNTLAEGARSFASGTKTVAKANNAHAEGLQTLASGVNGAHAEGSTTVASGNASHAEGNNTIASGSASHAEGTSCKAEGNYSHSGGRSSQVTSASEGGFAHGRELYVNQPYQTAFGQYNKVDSHFIFAIGNGSDNSSRANAFEVMNDGSAKVNDKTIATTDQCGTKLYKHHLIIDGEEGFEYPITVDLITSTSTPLSKDTPINLEPGFNFVSGKMVDGMDSPSILFSFSVFSNSRVSIFGIDKESEQVISKTATMTSLTDTVTEL